MNCDEAQEWIVETLQPNEHTAGCVSCAKFLEEQLAMDAVLMRNIVAPQLGAQFEMELKKQIRKEPMRLWPDWLPDALHFGGCVVVTAACVALMPVSAGLVLAAGAVVTVGGYLAQLVMREIIDL